MDAPKTLVQGGGGFSGHRQGSRRHRRPVVWLTESLRRDERLVDETRERRPTREMSRKKEKPSLKRNFNPLYRIEQKPCSPPKVVHALLHAQEVLHVLSEVAENFEISSTLPHHLGPRGPVGGNGRTWPEPNGSGRRGSAATGSGATVSILWLDVL